MRPVFLFPRSTILDCGASRTSLAVFSRGQGGRLRLEQYASVPLQLEPGAESRWLEKTTAALPTLRTRVEPSGPVTIVLPPHLTLLKMLGAPKIEAAKRDKVITFEGRQSIPYPLNEVVWDRQITGETEQGFNVLLGAAKLEAIDPLCAALVSAGLRSKFLVPSAGALAACFRYALPGSVVPTLLVNLGARSTTLVLLDKTGCQARSFALGGVGITQQIMEERFCDFARGEELKSHSPHEADVAQAIRMYAHRLGQEITRTLVHFRRTITAENVLRLVLTGGASRLPGLAGLLKTQLNVSVEEFDAVSAIELGRAVGDFNREQESAILAELIGGAALQIQTGQPTLNLLPLRLRHQAERRVLRPWVAVAAGLTVAGLGFTLVHQRNALAEIKAKNAVLVRELAPLRSSTARVEEKRQRLAEVERQQAAVLKVATSRTSWLRLLEEVQAKFVQTGDVWLERMRVLVPAEQPMPAESAGLTPLRIAFSGVMQPRAASAGEESYQRVRRLLENLSEVPQIAAVEGERFDPKPSGQLHFDIVVAVDAAAAL